MDSLTSRKFSFLDCNLKFTSNCAELQKAMSIFPSTGLSDSVSFV